MKKHRWSGPPGGCQDEKVKKLRRNCLKRGTDRKATRGKGDSVRPQLEQSALEVDRGFSGGKGIERRW